MKLDRTLAKHFLSLDFEYAHAAWRSAATTRSGPLRLPDCLPASPGCHLISKTARFRVFNCGSRLSCNGDCFDKLRVHLVPMGSQGEQSCIHEETERLPELVLHIAFACPWHRNRLYSTSATGVLRIGRQTRHSKTDVIPCLILKTAVANSISRLRRIVAPIN